MNRGETRQRMPKLRPSLIRVVSVKDGRVTIVFADVVGMVFAEKVKNGKYHVVLIGKFRDREGRLSNLDELHVPSLWFNAAVRQAAAIFNQRRASAK